jgi:N utilization substance protein B
MKFLYMRGLAEDMAFSDFCEFSNSDDDYKEERDIAVDSYASKIVEAVKLNSDEIDRYIKNISHNWDMSRIGHIERAILRLAIAEVLYMNNTRAIVINEAIEIARLYGSPDSTKFINGILDQMPSTQTVLPREAATASSQAPPGLLSNQASQA